MILRYLNIKFFINLFFVLTIFMIDRFSKIYVLNIDKKDFSKSLFSSEFLDINLIWNKGVAFGLFSFSNNTIYNFITLLIMIVIFIIFMMVVKSNGFKKYSLLMVLGGAFGNVYDRIIFGAVPDFIDFHIGNFHWFVFNVSDIFITIGVSCLIMVELFNNKQNDINEKN